MCDVSNLTKYSRGFTLIEMLVSLSLFTIVITITMGAFLSLIGNSGQLQNEQSIMTSLTFALDSMTREVRTGTEYVCTATASTTVYSATSIANCSATAGSTGISFREAGGSISGASGNRIAYFYDAANKTIMRRVGASPAQTIISSGITVTSAQFFVTGVAKLGSVPAVADRTQPTVTIIIQASETGAVTDKPFVIQTTITQRSLDL